MTIPPGWYVFDPQSFASGRMFFACATELTSGRLVCDWHYSTRRRILAPFPHRRSVQEAIAFSNEREGIDTSAWRAISADELTVVFDMLAARESMGVE